MCIILIKISRILILKILNYKCAFHVVLTCREYYLFEHLIDNKDEIMPRVFDRQVEHTPNWPNYSYLKKRNQ